MKQNSQRGAGRLKTAISLLIIAAMVYAGFKIAPPYLTNFQLLDALKTEARFAAVNRRSPDEVRENVFKKIKELEIPADRSDIRIEQLSNGGLRITVNYSVTVDFRVFQYTFDFSPTADNMSL